MSIDRGFRPAAAGLLGLAAALTALVAWALYFDRGLTLSHYDAKAHLVVARRIVDSVTPGWRQIGAVWLPLPQLIHVLPTQVDLLYRTGLAASLFSIACFATTVRALTRVTLLLTHSTAAAVTTGVLLIVNPNLLYLHTTPMTEPMLLAAVALCLLWTMEWLDDPGRPVPWTLRLALTAAAWTRYEAWLVAGALWLLSAATLWGTVDRRTATRRLFELAAGPAAAVLLFLLNGKLSTGHWLVTGGFYVPDPRYDGNPFESAVAVWWGTSQIAGFAVTALGLAAGAVVLRPGRGARVATVSLLAAGVLPFYALLQGHPYRVRYMVTTAVGCAVLCGVAIGAAGRRKALAAAVLLAVAFVELPPWSQRAPLVAESQWDVPVSAERAPVRRCLASGYRRGDKVLASMGSLAHVMQELAHDGFDIADFIHEGNGEVWNLALAGEAARHAGWMLIEEESEGGDVLAARIRRDPAFAAGMRRLCEGGGIALYRRG